MDNDEPKREDTAGEVPPVDSSAEAIPSQSPVNENIEVDPTGAPAAAPETMSSNAAVQSEPEPSAQVEERSTESSSAPKAKRKRSPSKRKPSSRRKKASKKKAESEIVAPEPVAPMFDLQVERLEGIPSASDEPGEPAEANPLADLIGQANEATTADTLAVDETPTQPSGAVDATPSIAAVDDITLAENATTEPEAFPFLEGNSSQSADNGDDIVAQAVREALENGPGEESVDPTAAEIESMPSVESTPSNVESAAPVTNDAEVVATSTRARRVLRALKRRLPQSFQRTAVRTLAACVLAIAAGFGYGAAVRTFFGGPSDDLRQDSAEQPETAHSTETDGSRPAHDAEPSHAAAPDDSHAEPAEHSAQGGETVEDHPAVASHGNERTTPSSEKFVMPALKSALPNEEHPLGIGRQRLNEGDMLAARRIATSYLLREDSLSADDRLLIPQAYALLADALSVEWGRKHPKSKDSLEVQALPPKPSLEPKDEVAPTDGDSIPMPLGDGEAAGLGTGEGGER